MRKFAYKVVQPLVFYFLFLGFIDMDEAKSNLDFLVLCIEDFRELEVLGGFESS